MTSLALQLSFERTLDSTFNLDSLPPVFGPFFVHQGGQKMVSVVTVG